jgi:heptose-I-phosphate ethanolaminephosphotransferase
MNIPRLRPSPAWLSTLPVAAALVFGFEGWRLLQMLLLAACAWLWLLRPSRHGGLRAMQALLTGLTATSFVLDAQIRRFLHHTYDASPSSAMVMTALANTQTSEVWEFLQMHGPRSLSTALVLGISLAWLVICLRAWWQQPVASAAHAPWQGLVLGLVLSALVLALVGPHWRGLHPLNFWSHWAGAVSALRTQWGQLDHSRRQLTEQAQRLSPVASPSSPDTLVLVISESINRQHLGIYGYPRQTSPKLNQKLAADPERLKMFSHAWSVDASTVPALQNFFYFGQQEGQKQHLLALAAAAGYQTWWISNQDDVAIEQEHARLAHHAHMINHRPGRGSHSLDHTSLPVLEQALRSAAPRKLIVLHLIGAHPDYKRRHVPGVAAFSGVKDGVYEGLKAQGRPSWVRQLRNDYDSALAYHDTVVAQTLALTRQLGGPAAAWVYFSDHGQDVGTSGNRAGHSMHTAEGYRIPLLMWGHGLQGLPPDYVQRPVRADWLAHSVVNLLDITWAQHAPDKDVLDASYRWRPPSTPVAMLISP